MRLRWGIFAHCGERPKALPLETASIFEKLLDQKTFRFKISKDFFDKLRTPLGLSFLFVEKVLRKIIFKSESFVQTFLACMPLGTKVCGVEGQRHSSPSADGETPCLNGAFTRAIAIFRAIVHCFLPFKQCCD